MPSSLRCRPTQARFPLRTDKNNQMPSFSDYSISNYGGMVIDQRRTRPYVEALTRAIGPQTVVLDIGTGTGFFALLAAKLGAARVYAIEPDSAIDVARLCAADNPNAERIRWIQGLSTEIDLPERVDVVIGDLHGTMPFFKHNIESLKDARIRHLKPGGHLLPRRDILHAAPASASTEYDTLRKPWEHNDHGINLRAARRFVANTWWKVRGEEVAADALLASPAQWGTVDYMSAQTSTLRGNADWIIERAGSMHGYYVWFDTDLGEGPVISNTPLLPSIAYGRAFFPLEAEVTVEAGDRVQVKLGVVAMEDDHIYTWDTLVTAVDGSRKARFRQSTFNAKPIAQRARVASEQHVPDLSDGGRVDLAILQGMAASQSQGAIAETLMAQFPTKFPTRPAALNRVVRVAGSYSHDHPAKSAAIDLPADQDRT